MIIEKQKELIDKLDNTPEIKRFKKLENEIKNNKEYLSLMEEFNSNKERYEKENILNEEIIKLRQKLFLIPGVKEYLNLEGEIRLLSRKISNSISSIVNTENCK